MLVTPERSADALQAIRTNFLISERRLFEKHMVEVSAHASGGALPLKVMKYIKLYKYRLPLDPTVRYFNSADTSLIYKRINELSGNGFEAWVSFAPLASPNGELVSIQGKTPLVKKVGSTDDYQARVLPILNGLPSGTWVKIFYDTHEPELKGTISGSIRVTSAGDIPEDREIIIGWGKTPDVRLIDNGIYWSTTNPLWRHMASTDPNPRTGNASIEVPWLLSKIFGPGNAYRRKMASLAQEEGKTCICYEFKIREGTQLPFFFIDYEYAGQPCNQASFGWFFYGREGD